MSATQWLNVLLLVTTLGNVISWAHLCLERRRVREVEKNLTEIVRRYQARLALVVEYESGRGRKGRGEVGPQDG